jgi:sugar lactone lactonase YvrE
MRLTRPFMVILALTAACKKPEPAVQQAAEPAGTMTVRDSFQTPESVLYDAAGDQYLVSNINGNPAAKDGNGFISRVSPSGSVTMLKWIEGGKNGVTLNAPKGMGIRGDTLFVADIDEVRMFDRTSGRPVGSIRVPHATFLNDVSVGPDGAVWFTDSGLKPDFSSSGTDAVYHRDPRGGALHQVAHGTDLGRPNGILADSTGAVVVTFGSGEVYRVDLQGHRTAMAKPPHGQLDGVVRAADGSLVVSSWEDSSVVGMKTGDTMYMMMQKVETPADIGLDTRRKLLLIPVFNGNRIEIRPIAPAATAHGQ